MSAPNLTVEEFAARIRGDRGFSSNAQRAESIHKSELVAAAAFDYARLVGYSGFSRQDHRRCCANHVAAQLRQDGVTIPQAAFGMPLLLVQLLFGVGVKLLVELIWRAAGLIADHLSGQRAGVSE